MALPKIMRRSPRSTALGLLFLFVAALLAPGCATRTGEVAARDGFPLDPREELSGPFPEEVDRGWAALLRGDASEALREFDAARREGHRVAAEVGWIEAAVLDGKFDGAMAACHDALAGGEGTVPLLVACAEANGRGGKPAEGYRLYRRAIARTAPSRPGLRARTEEIRLAARDSVAAEARVASEEKRWAQARDRIALAIDLAPEAAALRVLAGEIEDAAGEPDKAFRRYREAWEMDPKNAAIAERVGDLAMDLGDYALAVSVFDGLARGDAKHRARAEEARLAFRVSNWPAPEREAARSTRLSRASAAALVWWMFPEVREARVSAGVIASDAVSRRDTRAFARAVALGLLEVDRETHRGNPDGTLTRPAGARLLLRLIGIVRPRDEPSCLGTFGARAARGVEAIRAAEACGLWKAGGEGIPDGPEFTRALDRVRALAATPAGDASDD
ncbi:MAG: tetratricopeptide repeat protein [Acidobacteriota bacterium]